MSLWSQILRIVIARHGESTTHADIESVKPITYGNRDISGAPAALGDFGLIEAGTCDDHRQRVPLVLGGHRPDGAPADRHHPMARPLPAPLWGSNIQILALSCVFALSWMR